MADNNEIIIEIVAKLDNIEKQLKDVEQTAKESGEKAGEAFGKSLRQGFFQLVEIAGIVEGFKKIKEGLSSSIEEAIQGEKAINLLNNSLANAGNYTEAASEKFQAFAEKIQKTTAFSDDLVISNASVLASLGRLSGDGLERATKAALDFASTGRVGVEQAFDAIAKAANGNTQAFGRFGIKVDESGTKAEKLEAVLKQLETRFGGLSEAQGATFGGALAKIENGFKELEKTVGNLVIKSPALVAVLSELGKIIGEVTDQVKDFGKQNGIDSLVIRVIEGLRAAIPAAQIFFNILVGGASVVKFAFNAIIDVILAIPAGLAKVAGDVLQFASGVGDVVSVFNEDLGKGIKDGLQSAGEDLTRFGQALDQTVTEDFVGSFEELKASLTGLFNEDALAPIDAFLARLQTAAENAPPLAKTIKDNVGGAFDEVSAKALQAQQKINQAFQQGIINTISAGAQAIGASLVKGGKAFDNFKNQVLNIIGDMAIQIGSTLVGIGIGIDSIKASILGLSGGVAIAAGIALIALGGLLKSLSSGGGETSGVGAGTVGSGGGGQPDVGGGAFAAIAPDQDATRAKGTQVQVNVEGNVFNQRDTGLEIARIIQDQFDTNGQVIAQGGIA